MRVACSKRHSATDEIAQFSKLRRAASAAPVPLFVKDRFKQMGGGRRPDGGNGMRFRTDGRDGRDDLSGGDGDEFI